MDSVIWAALISAAAVIAAALIALRRKPKVSIKDEVTFDQEGKVIEHKRVTQLECYLNGAAPQAFAVPSPVELPQSLKDLLEDAERKTAEGQGDQLLPYWESLSATGDLSREDMVARSRICLSIGDSKFHQKKYADAETFYEEALNYARRADEPRIIEISLYELGAAVGMQGRPEEALAHFEEVIKMNEANPGAWYNKGVALSLIGKGEAAILAYREAIEFGKKAQDWGIVASAHQNMGNALSELKRHQEAVDSYPKAIEFGKKAQKWRTVASAHYNMGNALGNLERHQEAVASYLEAIKLRGYLPDKGECTFLAITPLILADWTASLVGGNRGRTKELAETLAQVFKEASKDGLTDLITKTLDEAGSKLSGEAAETFEEFRAMFDKACSPR